MAKTKSAFKALKNSYEDIERMTVKDNKKDRSLCIVDDNNYRSKDWELNDGVGQRLLMLSHDKKLANDIYENGDRIDKWWLNIMNENGTN